MKYTEFVSAMKDEVETMVGMDMRVEIHATMKNNGKERVGLAIKDEKVNVMPAIYLEEYYEMYCRGTIVKTLAKSIWEVYEKVRIRDSWNVEMYQDYNKIKPKLACKLINYEKNKALLREVPHVPYLDLAIVFYLLIESKMEWSSTMLIKTEHMNGWGVSEPQLYKDAMENVEKILPAKLEKMSDVIMELLDEELAPRIDKEERMYVLSNDKRNLGAVCMMYHNILQMVGEMLREDYYIIPSSIHEILIVPISKAISRDHLEEMIREVNSFQVEDEEILSDCAYYYSREKETLYN